MKKIFLILCVFFLLGCNQEETFKIGFSATLSGDGSELGIALRNGLMIKIDEINENGGIRGRQLELVIKDDEGSNEKVRQVDKSFIEEGIVIFIGHDISGKILPILETINNQNIIAVSGTIATQYATNKVDNFYRTMTSNANQGIVMAEYLCERTQGTLIIYDEKNLEYGISMIEQFESVYSGNIIKYGMKTSVLKEIDKISSYIENENFENIITITNQEDAVNLHKYIRNEALNVVSLTSNWGLVGDEISSFGKDLDGLVCTVIGGNVVSNELYEFKTKYLDRYDEEASIAAEYGYEAGIFVESVLQEADGWDYESLTKEIRQPRTINGLANTIIVNEYGDAERDLYLSIVRNGQLIRIE